ncbi:MAG: hypothetical protein DVB31_07645, partial [Verrucomicrobia bacterium]
MRSRIPLVAIAVMSLHWMAAALSNEPARGLGIPADARAELEAGAVRLETEISGLGRTASPGSLALLPDVRVLHRAVASVLAHDEFQHTNDVATARQLLALAFARAAELRAGRPSWPTATGLVVRGFVSRIDGSVQP